MNKVNLFYDIKVEEDLYNLELEVPFDKLLFSKAALAAFAKFAKFNKIPDQDKFFYTNSPEICKSLSKHVKKILKEIESTLPVRLITRNVYSAAVNPKKARMKIFISGACIKK